jgi:hypothetical protein
MTSFAPQSFLWYPTARAATRVPYISRPMALHSHLPVSLGLLILAGACAQRDRSSTAGATPPPNAEFLVATQDSTFWVTTAGAKLRARGAPLTLAQFDGKFYEVFLADDDRSYRDALLVGLRLYRRDLQLGDSTLVFEDSIVPRFARQYASAHPGAQRLAPDEDGDEDPPMQATADLQVVDVHGPYLSFEYHVDVATRGSPPWHATRRGVLDLRSGRPARVADLFPEAVASALIDSGRRELSSAIDSLRGDSRTSARHAVAALTRARFDERSFVLTVPDSALAVEFDVPQRGVDAPDEVLPLDALRPSRPEWWTAIAHNFPEAENDLDRWRADTSGGYEVLARYDSAAETARLSLAERGHEWPVRAVTAPVLHLFWLDRPPVDSAQRRALLRAFDEASLYDESTRTVRDIRRHLPRPHFVALRGAGARNSRHGV